MTDKKSIVVVGGGSAGWMSAAYLSAKGHAVTLVESDNVPIVGVGESTLPAMNSFCQELGLTEEQWMPMCSAVKKLGIWHCDWNDDPQSWWHWFVYDRQQHHTQIKYLNKPFPPQHRLEYGYHVDAVQFGQSLKPLAQQHGCQHIVDHVVSVGLGSDGAIDHLVTEGGKILKADYYVDCTGWAKLLCKAVGTRYEPYQDLLNDSAIACPQPLTGEPKPYTITRRMSAGWTWEIALTHRRGVGYVYSSQYISDQDAIEEYCKQYPETDRSRIRKLKFTPEKCLDPFNKNVCAVGLSAGFIEPLEATSLFLTQYNIMRFNDVISNGRDPKVFNRMQSRLVDEIYLHILAHYTLAGRTDNEYWQYYCDLEQRLNTEKLVRERAAQPDVGQWSPSKMFFPYSWWALLYGYGMTQ